MNEWGAQPAKAKSAFFMPGTKSEIRLLCLGEIGSEPCKLLLFTFVPAPEPFPLMFSKCVSGSHFTAYVNIVSTQYGLLIYDAAQLAHRLELQICHVFFKCKIGVPLIVRISSPYH
jgi:hypothetical protein